MTKFLIYLLAILGCGFTYADMSLVASDLGEGLGSGQVIAVQPVDAAQAKIDRGTAAALTDQLTNEVQRAAAAKGARLVERTKLDAIMMEQEEFQSEREFSALVENAGADVLISPSVNRISSSEVQISARAIGVKGALQGKVISASKIYQVAAPQKYVAVVKAITQSGNDQMKYSAPLIGGLTSHSEFSVTQPGSQADFEVSVELALNVTEKQTDESKQAAKDAQGAQMAGQLFGSMMGGGANPFGGMLSQQGAMAANEAESLKQKVITVDVSGNMLSTLDGSIISSTVTEEVSIGNDEGESRLKAAAKQAVQVALERLGKDLASKALGKPIASSSGSGLLD